MWDGKFHIDLFQKKARNCFFFEVSEMKLDVSNLAEATHINAYLDKTVGPSTRRSYKALNKAAQGAVDAVSGYAGSVARGLAAIPGYAIDSVSNVISPDKEDSKKSYAKRFTAGLKKSIKASAH